MQQFFFLVNIFKIPLHVFFWKTITLKTISFNLVMAPAILFGVFLGIQMQRGVYNTIMWIIVLGLLSLGVSLFLLFKRSFVVTSQTKHELENIQKEYEEHRKSSREKYEKLVVSHHSEIMKMKRS